MLVWNDFWTSDLRFCEMQDSSCAESGFLPIGAIKSKQHRILLLPAFKFSRRLIDVPRHTRETDEAKCPIHASPIIILGIPHRQDAPDSFVLHLSSYAKKISLPFGPWSRMHSRTHGRILESLRTRKHRTDVLVNRWIWSEYWSV